MEEIWKNIDPDGIYKISNLGRVKTSSRKGSKGECMKPSVGRKGYLGIDLRYGGKRHCCKIHRLVALAFIPNPNNYPEINHKDEDKTNNRVDNLEWCDHWYNIHYGTGAERGRDALRRDVNQYDKQGNFIKCWHGVKTACATLGLDSSCIVRCCDGSNHTYGGFIWLYVDTPSLEEKLRERVEWAKRKHHSRYGRGATITQRDMDGNIVNVFKSIREALRKTDAQPYTLNVTLTEDAPLVHKGYIWSKSYL